MTRVHCGGEFKLFRWTRLSDKADEIFKWPTLAVKPPLCALSFISRPLHARLKLLFINNHSQLVHRASVRNRLMVLLLCCAWWDERMCAQGLWMREAWWLVKPLCRAHREADAEEQFVPEHLFFGQKSDTLSSWRALCERPIIVEKWTSQACFEDISNRYN